MPLSQASEGGVPVAISGREADPAAPEGVVVERGIGAVAGVVGLAGPCDGLGGEARPGGGGGGAVAVKAQRQRQRRLHQAPPVAVTTAAALAPSLRQLQRRAGPQLPLQLEPPQLLRACHCGGNGMAIGTGTRWWAPIGDSGPAVVVASLAAGDESLREETCSAAAAQGRRYLSSSDQQRARSPSGAAGLEGKVCIVTGGNAGVGKATARELAARGAQVIIACRSAKKGEEAVQDISLDLRVRRAGKASGVRALPLDLSSFQSIRSFVKEFDGLGLPLDVLVNNAGIMAPPERAITADGFESQWQVNYLGHFLLTQELLRVPNVARRVSDDPLRVVNLTSMTHYGGHIHFDDLNFLRRYHAFAAYAQSKLAIVLSTKELQRRQPDIVAVSVHPGLINTALARGFFMSRVPRPLRGLLAPLYDIFLKDSEKAVSTMMYAITAPAREVAGSFVMDSMVRQSHKKSYDVELASKLWATSMDLTAKR
eukprot:SM000056S18007  [mRNA]  locus=s56:589388:594997:+ [translate_table: standard]